MIDDIERMIIDHGRAISLRRLAGLGTARAIANEAQHVMAAIQTNAINPLIGDVTQVSDEVRVSSRMLTAAGWTGGHPRTGDQVYYEDIAHTTAVEATPDMRAIDGAVIYIMRCRGS